MFEDDEERSADGSADGAAVDLSDDPETNLPQVSTKSSINAPMTESTQELKPKINLKFAKQQTPKTGCPVCNSAKYFWECFTAKHKQVEFFWLS